MGFIIISTPDGEVYVSAEDVVRIKREDDNSLIWTRSGGGNPLTALGVTPSMVTAAVAAIRRGTSAHRVC